MEELNKELENTNEQIVQERKYKKFTALKIISAVVWLITLAWLIYGAIDVAMIPLDNNGRGISVAFFLTFNVIIFGGIGNAISLIISLVGTLTSLVGYKQGTVKLSTLITFLILFILPIITEVIFIIVAKNL